MLDMVRILFHEYFEERARERSLWIVLVHQSRNRVKVFHGLLFRNGSHFYTVLKQSQHLIHCDLFSINLFVWNDPIYVEVLFHIILFYTMSKRHTEYTLAGIRLIDSEMVI